MYPLKGYNFGFIRAYIFKLFSMKNAFNVAPFLVMTFAQTENKIINDTGESFLGNVFDDCTNIGF